MHIEIENTQLSFNDFPNKNRTDERWYTTTQQALLFKDNAKYPDKFEINLLFESHKTPETASQNRSKVVPIKAGLYQLSEDAWYINQRNGLDIDDSRLVPLKQD